MKIFYFIVGIISLLLGGIGVLLPIVPTTPFLLLSAFCFAKSSQRFYQWFTNTKLYNMHLQSFIEKREMTIRTKIRLLSFASMMLLLAIYLVKIKHLQIFLAGLMVFKYYYFIFHIKTIPAKRAL